LVIFIFLKKNIKKKYKIINADKVNAINILIALILSVKLLPKLTMSLGIVLIDAHKNIQ
jgi:hypothetical protein